MPLTTLPVLSLADDAAAFSQAIGDSFKTFGFAMVKDFDIDRALIERAWQLSEAFFALPEAEKRAYHDPAIAGARGDTLSMFARFEQALPGLQVPLHPELNPPLWELGHIGWFQAWWLARFPAWPQGWRADPDLPRRPDRRADADVLYNSSLVPHDSRWTLPLPAARIRWC